MARLVRNAQSCLSDTARATATRAQRLGPWSSGILVLGITVALIIFIATCRLWSRAERQGQAFVASLQAGEPS